MASRGTCRSSVSLTLEDFGASVDARKRRLVAAGPHPAAGVRAPPRVGSYVGSIATSGSRFFGSGLRVPGGTRVISSTTLSLNGVGIPTWRPCSET